MKKENIFLIGASEKCSRSFTDRNGGCIEKCLTMPISGGHYQGVDPCSIEGRSDAEQSEKYLKSKTACSHLPKP